LLWVAVIISEISVICEISGSDNKNLVVGVVPDADTCRVEDYTGATFSPQSVGLPGLVS
jgi:hypothetical protein